MSPKYLVAQIGPRRSYAVPRVLEKAGLLEAFYTDICADLNPGKLFCHLGKGFDAGLIKRLRGRHISNEILPKTKSFAWPALRYEITRRLAGTNPFRQACALSNYGELLGRAMARSGFGNATHLYTMLGDVTPLLEAARKQGVTTVTEIYIFLTAENKIAEERLRYPGFEPVPPKQILDQAYAWLRRVIALTDWFVVPSEAVGEDLVKNFEVGAERCLLVPYAAADHWFKVQNEPVPGRVLFVGSAGLRKGIHTLGQAALQLEGKGYSFHVAGGASSRVRQHPLTVELNFLGRIPRVEVVSEYQKADVFVLPSLAEGSAEVTYEALAAGIPVITTWEAGSVVRNGIEGFIVPPSEPQALVDNIVQVVEDRGLRSRMALAARERAKEYTVEKYQHRLVDALMRA